MSAALPPVVVVDYGVGNIGALVNMYEFLGYECIVSREAHSVRSAQRLILPGVGSFDRAIRGLRGSGLLEPLEDAVLGDKVPILGICLGMQLLGRNSEEGGERGLSWIAAQTVRILQTDPRLKVPHIGWNEIVVRKKTRLFASTTANARFYFTHSYHLKCDDDRDVAATIEYGDRLCCAVEHENIFGVQFHPEKSHRHGMAVLRAFAEVT